MGEEEREALRHLLRAFFSAGELRRFVEQYYRDIAATLGHGVSGAELVHQVMSALERQARIDAALFDRLRAERPRRADEIRAVASMWLDTPPPSLGSPPPAPPVFVGRHDDVATVLDMLQHGGVCGIHGLPGMGKTALATVVARHPDVIAAFPGGVAWLSVGPDHSDADLLGTLNSWGDALDAPALRRAGTVGAALAAFRAITEARPRLVVADDVWSDGDVRPLGQAIGEGSAVLLTSRDRRLVTRYAPVARARLQLKELDEVSAMELMAAIVPDAVRDHRPVIASLCRALNYTPLGLVVAARRLAVDGESYGGVAALATLLATGDALLDAQAPAGMPWRRQTIPTVANILQSSTDALSQDSRRRFAALGKFRPKPATFPLDVLEALWNVDDARPHVAELVQRGLVEAAGDGRFQIHALLRSLAKTLWSEMQ